jgi:hypothetical protein
MPETLNRKDVAFSREDFFMGGPAQKEVPIEIRVEDGRQRRDTPEIFRLLYRFTNMLVQSVSVVDAERTQYLLSSNDTIKLYTFDRSVTVLAIQAVIIDGKPKPKKLLAKPDPIPVYQQDAFAQFMWLYEHELKMTSSIRKNRRIVIRVKDHDHEVLVSNYNEGFASQGEWMVMLGLELIVLNAQVLGVGPAEQLRQGTEGKDILPTASRELLYNRPWLEQFMPDTIRDSSGRGVAGQVRQRALQSSSHGVSTVGPALNIP